MARGQNAFWFAVMLAVAGSVAVTPPARAQQQTKAQQASEHQKKQAADKKRDEEAYKASLGRIPNKEEKIDPWGGMRGNGTTAGAK